MSKLTQGLAAAAFLGLAGAGILALDKGTPAPEVPTASIVASVDPSTWRVGLARWSCLQAAGVTAETLREVCLHGEKRGDWVGCLTDREQRHACELDEVDIPDEAVQRFGVCRYRDADNVWQTWAGWAPIGEAPPAGWTCQVILPRGWWLHSMGGVTDALVLALRAKCGWGEAITGDRWHCCPHCRVWPAGCPPCVDLCKYGPDWPGRESECGG